MMKSKQQIIDDGQEAKRLLDDTDLSRFMDEIKQDCWVQFEATALDDREGREAIYMTLRGSKRCVNRFEQWSTTLLLKNERNSSIIWS